MSVEQSASTPPKFVHPEGNKLVIMYGLVVVCILGALMGLMGINTNHMGGDDVLMAVSAAFLPTVVALGATVICYYLDKIEKAVKANGGK